MKFSRTASAPFASLLLLCGCWGGDGNQALVTVPTAHLAITLSAPNAFTGTAYNFTVTALDKNDMIVPSYVGTVRITSSDAAAKLPADATLSGGLGVFAITFNGAGTHTITASDTAGNAISVTSAAVGVVTLPNPVPTIEALGSRCTPQGQLTLNPLLPAQGELDVFGQGFAPGAIVRWNGSDRPTTYTDGNRVNVRLSTADVASIGSNVVTVYNPAPGGGVSNAYTFTISSGTVGPSSIGVSPGGTTAYVATAGCDPAGIGFGFLSAYSIDPLTGLLSSLGPPVPSGDLGPADLAVGSDGRSVYLSNWGYGETSGSIVNFAVNQNTGAVTFGGVAAGFGCVTACVLGPASIALSPDGRYAYAANSLGFAPTSFSVFAVSVVEGDLIPLMNVTAPGRAVQVAVNPISDHVFGVSCANERCAKDDGVVISTYKVGSTGVLTRVETVTVGSTSGRITPHPGGSYLYMTAPDLNAVLLYSFNSTTGHLTSQGSVLTGFESRSLFFSPSGQFAYVSTGGPADGVSVYGVDIATGQLTLVGPVTGAKAGPMAFDPAGKFAYVTNIESDRISVFSINAANGMLTLVGTVTTT